MVSHVWPSTCLSDIWVPSSGLPGATVAVPRRSRADAAARVLAVRRGLVPWPCSWRRSVGRRTAVWHGRGRAGPLCRDDGFELRTEQILVSAHETDELLVRAPNRLAPCGVEAFAHRCSPRWLNPDGVPGPTTAGGHGFDLWPVL